MHSGAHPNGALQAVQLLAMSASRGAEGGSRGAPPEYEVKARPARACMPVLFFHIRLYKDMCISIRNGVMA